MAHLELSPDFNLKIENVLKLIFQLDLSCQAIGEICASALLDIVKEERERNPSLPRDEEKTMLGSKIGEDFGEQIRLYLFADEVLKQTDAMVSLSFSIGTTAVLDIQLKYLEKMIQSISSLQLRSSVLPLEVSQTNSQDIDQHSQ